METVKVKYVFIPASVYATDARTTVTYNPSCCVELSCEPNALPGSSLRVVPSSNHHGMLHAL